jgi:hypothetical protein
VKGSPKRLIKAHYGTYVRVPTGDQMIRDHALFEGVPLVVAVVCVWRDIHLPTAASVGLLTVAGLLSAFLFGVMLQISERAMSWADSQPERGEATSAHADFLRDVAANAGYAALVSVATAVAFVVVSATPHTAEVVLSAVGLGLATHLVLVLLLVITRVFALIDQRLIKASASENVTRLDDQRKTG